MTEAPADRTYWTTGGAWHATAQHVDSLRFFRAACGRVAVAGARTADRVPSNGHLCGSCSRVIAARTDIENHSVTAPAGIS